MARARNIKPKFFQNDELGELHPLARLLFIGMWTIADFKGCLEFRPKRIKTQILPYDECDIEQLTSSLDKSGFISIYTVQERRYIKIIKFAQHQTPHKNEREAGSEIPDMEENGNGINKLKEDGINPDKNGTTPAESLFPLPDSLNLNPESGTPPAPAQKVRQQPRDAADDQKFTQAWEAYPKRPGASRADAHKAWAARIKEKVDPDAIIAGVRRYADYVKKAGTEPQFIKQPATFFGPGEHYAADWSLKVSAPATAAASRHSGFDEIDYSEGVEDGRIT